MDRSSHFIANILVVSDDVDWYQIMLPHLNRYFLRSFFSTDYHDAQYTIFTEKLDIILVKKGLSASDHIVKTENNRKSKFSPHIIVIASRSELLEPTYFLDNGADDYFHSSYSSAEIIARLHSIQRRRMIQFHLNDSLNLRKVNQPSLRFRFRDWVLDCATSKLYSPSGKYVPLTKGERTVITKLVLSQGYVQTRDDLNVALNHALKGGVSGQYNRTADTAISRLRRKLANYIDYELIETVAKEGYRIAVPVFHVSDE